MKYLARIGLAVILLTAGCSRPAPDDTSIDDAIKDWNCLYQTEEDANPFDPMPSSPPQPFASFCQSHKAVLDDAQAYMAKEIADHTPPSPPHEFVDIWEVYEGVSVHESAAGLHAVRYDMRIKDKYYDWDATYLLLYDAADKRTRVMFTKHPHPSRGFG